MIMYNPFLFLTTSTMIISSLMAISSTNWLFVWAALEINMLSFIPIMMNSKNFQETEAAVKYFLVQALGSSILLMSSISSWFIYSIPNHYITILLFMALLLKMGMAPCHAWYPSVMTSVSWMSALILSTWQKLAPLMIMSFILTKFSTHTMMFIASLNAMVGGLLGMNQAHLRTIMAYSSITHMGWMMSLISIMKPLFSMFYFAVYSIIIAPIFIILHIKNMPNSSYSNKLISHSPMFQFILPLLLLSLSGLPPLTGFIPKWMTISMLAAINMPMTIILIIGALMNTYYYLNITFMFMLSTKQNMVPVSASTQLPHKLLITISSFSLFFLPVLMLN